MGPLPSPGRALRRLGVLALLLAMALVTMSAREPREPREASSVRVVHGSKVVWKFHTAQCARSKGRFTAVLGSKHSPYAMAVVIPRFDEFGDYPVLLGIHSLDDVFLKLFGPKDAAYSNFYAPPFPSPGAGEIRFDDGGKLMGVGFGPAMYTRDASDAVVVTGVATCKYKHKHKKKKH